MSFGGKLARGLLQGLSGYYGEQAKSQAEERKMELLAARERALSEMNHTNRLDEISASGRESRTTYSANKETDVIAETALLGPKTEAEERLVRVKGDVQKDVGAADDARDQANAVSLEGLKHDYRMTEDQAKITAEKLSDIEKAGKIVDHTEVSADGRLVFYSKTGERLSKTFAGAFEPPSKRHASRNDDDELGLGDDTTPASKGPAKAGPAKAANVAKAPAATEDYTKYRQLLAEASVHPQLGKLSARERLARVRELAERNGIPIPPGE